MNKIVGLLGWLGVLLVVGALGLRFAARPDWFWAPQWSNYLAWAGLAVTALYGLSQWRDIGRSFQGRNAKYGSVAVGSVLVFLGILVGINWIASRENKRWDLTSNQQFELSDQTKKILTELKKPVNVRVYYSSQSGSLESYRDKLEEYRYQTKLVTAEYIDADKEPMRAQQDKVDAVPTILVQYDGRTERATSIDEQNLTNALKKAIEGKAKKLYFVQGHGEHDIEGSDGKGYSEIVKNLKTDNFDVAAVTLAQTGKIADDATAVIIAGPKNDYLAPEVEALRVYLKKGGKLLLMVDPPDRLESAPLTNLIAFAREWGVELGNNIIIDQVGQMVAGNALTPIATRAGTHAITRDFNVMTAFPVARSATPVEGGANGHVAQKVLQTSPQAWGETDIKELITTHSPKLDPAKDMPGPVTLISAVSAAAPDAAAPDSPDLPRPESRMVVAGDSDFLSNNLMNPQLGNSDLGLNIANWLAQQESLIAIRPKDPDTRTVTMTTTQKSTLSWLTLIIIPLLLIGNGIRVWWRRR